MKLDSKKFARLEILANKLNKKYSKDEDWECLFLILRETLGIKDRSKSLSFDKRLFSQIIGEKVN